MPTQKTQDEPRALENAIRGVEEFSKHQVGIPAAPPLPETTLPVPFRSPPAPLVPQVRARSHLDVDTSHGRSTAARTPWPHLRRALAVIVILVGALLVFQQRQYLKTLTDHMPSFQRQTATKQPRVPAQIANDPAPQPPPPAQPAPLRPTDYGVYAIGDDSLSELQLLPGRPPDIRIAVSAAIKAPSRTFLTNGHPKFIVFRRDVASSISDRAEVRIIAKVAREFSAEVAGKKPVNGEDTWVIRNVSFPFRSSPVRDNPEMYELHSEDPELELTPGRYAMVLKEWSSIGFYCRRSSCRSQAVYRADNCRQWTYYSDCKNALIPHRV